MQNDASPISIILVYFSFLFPSAFNNSPENKLKFLQSFLLLSLPSFASFFVIPNTFFSFLGELIIHLVNERKEGGDE